MFFKHKYLTQPSVTPLNAIVQATDDFCTVLKGWLPVKSAMRSAVELLMDIYKRINIRSEQTDINTHRANQDGASAQKETTEQNELEGVWVKPDEAELADNNL
jgi:hypothetical protein